MNPTKYIDIETYTPQAGETFYFDTNIWMFLYCPVGNYKRAIIGKYDRFLKNILQNQSAISISSLILSEFFNAYLRLEFSFLKGANPRKYRDYKRDFRKKKIYEKKALEVKIIVERQILALARRIDDKFSQLNIDDLLEEIELSDFNDKFHAMLAASDCDKIVTHDADYGSFKKISVPVITANKKLLYQIA